MEYVGPLLLLPSPQRTFRYHGLNGTFKTFDQPFSLEVDPIFNSDYLILKGGGYNAFLRVLLVSY